MDWVGIENRNYHVKGQGGLSMQELLWALVPFVLITGLLIFHLWVRSQIIDTGYEIHKLTKYEENLTREMERLVVKVESLQSPDRIDRIARGRLGMEPLRPDQVLVPHAPDIMADRSAMALASGY